LVAVSPENLLKSPSALSVAYEPPVDWACASTERAAALNSDAQPTAMIHARFRRV
jgi:hypothetical protein